MSNNRQATKRKTRSKNSVQRQSDSSNQTATNSRPQTPKPRNKSTQGQRNYAPLSSTRSQKVGDASIKSTRDGIVVKHRELVVNLSPSSGGFSQLARLRCNPASVGTFRWLSTIASSWETYRFRKLAFQYIARAPATTAGSLIMSPDYDARDGQPVNEMTMSELKDTVECSPWEDINLHLSSQSMNRAFKSHFTMSDDRFAQTTQDVKTIDAAQVFVACDSDVQGNWGKLWVEYECEFRTPQPPTAGVATGGVDIQFDNVSFSSSGNLPPFSAANCASFIRNVNASDPIISVAPQPDGSIIGTFLRDFQGMVNWNYSGPSIMGTPGSYLPSIIGKGLVGGPIGTPGFGDNGNGAPSPNPPNSISYRASNYIKAVLGDQLISPSIISALSGSNGALNVVLGALPQ